MEARPKLPILNVSGGGDGVGGGGGGGDGGDGCDGGGGDGVAPTCIQFVSSLYLYSTENAQHL